MLVDSRRGLLVSGGLLAGAAAVTVLVVWPVTLPAVQAVDDWVWRLAGSVENRPTTAVAVAMSWLGSVWVNWPLRIAALVLLAWRRHWIRLTAFGLSIITSELLIGSLKAAVDRPRPPLSLIETSGASFPSGHAIAGAVPGVPAGALAVRHRGRRAARGGPRAGLAGPADGAARPDRAAGGRPRSPSALTRRGVPGSRPGLWQSCAGAVAQPVRAWDS
jgi:hypothetical protein